MEELRSTEILDKEIEADARKKAEKILGRAEDECKSILDGVQSRVDAASKEKKAYYDAKLVQFKKSVEEAFPLEKERFLVKYYSDSVSASFNEYLEKLGEEKRLVLVEKRIAGLSKSVTERKLNAKVFGFSLASAKKLLEKSLSKNLAKIEEVSFEKSGEEAALGNAFHEGIILSSDDGFVKVRLTIDQIVRETKDKYSNELATSLFGGRLPE